MEIEEEVDIIGSIRSALVAYWLLFAGAVVFFLILGFLYLRYTSPTFRVSAKILVKDDKKTGVGGAGSILSELDLFGGKKIVENELEILKSRPIIESVVRKTNCNIKVYKNGRIRDVLQGLDFPIQIFPVFPDSIDECADLLRLKVTSDGHLELNGTLASKQDTLFVNGDKKSRQVGLVVDHKRLWEIAGQEFYVSSSSIKKEIKEILKSFTVVTVNKNTSVIDLSYDTRNIQRGETILKLIIESYSDAATSDKRQIAQFTLDFIEGRLSLVTSQLDSVEKDIELFKENNSIVDLSQQGKLFLESVKEEDKELNQMEIQMNVLNDVEGYLKGKGVNPGNLPSLVGISDQNVVSMLNRLYEMEFGYQKRKGAVGGQDEELLMMESEIGKLRTSLMESVGQLKQHMSSTIRRLKSELSLKMSSLTSLPGKERMLLDISRQQAIKNSIYTFLLEKREESAISFASTVSDVRLVEPAQGDADPVKPRKLVVLIACILLGFVLPGAYVYYFEVLTGKIKFRSDIESRTKLTVLGEIYQGTEDSDFIIGSDNRSAIAESVRSVRSKMSYYLKGEGSQVILISSCLPGEGKSFITTNIALSLALMGKKTVVIAADMRKPRIHKAFGVSGTKGLSQVLINKLSIDEAVEATNYKDLFIMPPGPIPPNPAELLLNKEFGLMIDYLKSKYDFVIIDSPPLGLISDAEIMAEQADFSLFVVRHDHSLKEAVKNILGPIDESSKFWPAAVVYNGIKTRGMGRYGQGYGYGYGYGYGAGYGDSSNSSSS
jgi:capsular exopolysaccharide synthesis family protein